jgi:signal transduction histidine kinase
MRSLRAHLLLGASITAVIALGGSLLMAFVFTRQATFREFDAALIAQTRAATTMAVRDGKRLRIEFDAVEHPDYLREERPDVFCFRDRHGFVLLRSPALLGDDLPPVMGSVESPQVQDVRLPDGRPARLAGFWFTAHLADEDLDVPLGGRSLSVAVARDTAERDQHLMRLAAILASVALLGAAGIVLGMWWLTRRLMRPLDDLGRRIGGITAERLGERLGDLPLPSELVPVRAHLDALLDRLEAAFARERAFTADAAHELRTPLAGLRTTLEVAVMQERPAMEYRQSLRDGLEIGIQLQGLVENLLALARLEAGQVRIDRQATGLVQLVNDCWATVNTRANERGLRFSRELPDGDLPLDRAKLRLVLSNLLDNAVSYADAGGDIRLGARREGHDLILEMSNSGCTLPAAAADQVFARFWRGDTAHSSAGVHCGLGLALCRQLVACQGGTITATISDGRFTVQLRLPLGD